MCKQAYYMQIFQEGSFSSLSYGRRLTKDVQFLQK